jgi:hypothetical protein
MLRVRAIHHGASRAVVKYLDAYLTKARGEPPGRWMGRGAALLGLDGLVDSGDFQRTGRSSFSSGSSTPIESTSLRSRSGVD